MSEPTSAASVPVSPAASPPGERIAMLAFIAWVALLGIERVDLLGGRAGFVVTPFLVFTPLLLALETLRVGSFRLSVKPPDRRAAVYTLVLMCLVCVAVVSTLAAADVVDSGKRSMDLVAVSVGTLLVALFFGRRPWVRRALASGAELGIALAFVFTAAQLVAFFGGTRVVHLGPVSVDLTPLVYAGVVPRVSGQVQDPNRAGLLLLFYVFLIARGREPGLRRRFGMAAGLLLLLLTLSRSAILGSLAAGTVAFLTSRHARVSRPVLLAATVLIGGGAAVLLARPGARAGVEAGLHPLRSRLSLSESSAETHVYLISKGLEEATASVHRATLGVGYGDAFTVLQDVFPGNRYGNFHSLLVTLFAEAGVVALLLGVVLMGYPLLRPGPYLPMIAALWVFDLFYQANADPDFWLILALAWITSRQLSLRPRPHGVEDGS